MKSLLHPAYLPNIVTFSIIVQGEVQWEVWDNFQKQTFRNRCYVCTDRGKHMMNIPVKHLGAKNGRQLYRDVQIDNSYPWLRQHWRTLQTAYRTSPFFEFYEDDIAPLYQEKEKFLLDFNLKATKVLGQCLQVSIPELTSSSYLATPPELYDLRSLVNAKIDVSLNFPEYIQVFGDRHGFTPNMSVIDLLFNEGPATLDYLKKLALKPIYD